MRVLVACESSGRVREAFRRRGHDAWSCDLLWPEDGSPFHYTGSILDHEIVKQQWDLLIAHPDCTFLTVSANRWAMEEWRIEARLAGRPATNGRGEPQVVRTTTPDVDVKSALNDAKGRWHPSRAVGSGGHIYVGPAVQPNRMPIPGLKPKDLVMVPARAALALQADGWWLRQDIIWAKPNPMPESVRDRCTKSHEYIFLLSKGERYYFDVEAIAEPAARPEGSGNQERKPASARGVPVDTGGKSAGAVAGSVLWEGTTRNKRSVWTVTTKPFKEAHFATFPPALIEPCILAGAPRGGVVLDPFGGAGTTGLVADRSGRDAVLIELNAAYADMAQRRITGDSPLFSEVAA